MLVSSNHSSSPWMAASLHVYGVYKREREVAVHNTQTGERERKVRKRYDVRFRVDG